MVKIIFFKKIIIITIIFLLISINNVQSSEIILKKYVNIILNGNILYVGGSGPGNYTNIQDAIDNASDGDTVFVYNGTYTNLVIVDKRIDLIGEDKNSTIIEGEWEILVYILADGVLVTGFTIQKCGFYYSGGIDICSDHNTIMGNSVTGEKQPGGGYFSPGVEAFGDLLENPDVKAGTSGKRPRGWTCEDISLNVYY